MFPTHTNFVIKTIGVKKILFAETTFKDMLVEEGEEITISVSLAQVEDIGYPIPLRIQIVNGRIRFLDVKFIDIYREDIL